jgi:hypothetical protein
MHAGRRGTVRGFAAAMIRRTAVRGLTTAAMIEWATVGWSAGMLEAAGMTEAAAPATEAVMAEFPAVRDVWVVAPW